MSKNYFFYLSFLCCVILFSSKICYSQVHVKGYYRKNGTYVQPHTRSLPDGISSNNKSSYSTGSSIKPLFNSNSYSNTYRPSNPKTTQTEPSLSSNNFLQYNHPKVNNGNVNSQPNNIRKDSLKTTAEDYERSVYQRAKKECEGLHGVGHSMLAFCIPNKMKDFKQIDQLEAKYN